MADGSGRALTPAAAERLAAVCTHLEQIRADLRDGQSGDAAPVELLLAAVRSGADISRPLAELHAVLQAEGDPLGLDGYLGITGGHGRGLKPAGISSRPKERVHLCPTDVCARYWLPSGAEPAPRCAVSGAELRRERL